MADMSTPSTATASLANPVAESVLEAAQALATATRARVAKADVDLAAAKAGVEAAAAEYATAKAQLIAADATVEAAKLAANPISASKIIHYSWIVGAILVACAIGGAVYYFVR
jgi:hypothetical protein